MKVGIITFHWVSNYGAVLQCVALQRAIKRLGHEPFVIDFRPAQDRPRRLWRGWRYQGSYARGITRRLVQLRHGSEVDRRFADFRESTMRLTNPCFSAKDVDHECRRLDLGALVTGSDQVWHFNRDAVYFLSWNGSDRYRRIAYAPSCASEDQDPSKLDEIAGRLSGIHAISVRDSASERLIGRVAGRSPTVVADPTLIADPITAVGDSAPDSGKGDYVLVYTIGDVPVAQLRKAVRVMKERFGVGRAVSIVSSSQSPRTGGEADEVVFNASPEEWVALIRGSHALLTDSFHGCLFAMKHDRPFLGFYTEAIRAPRLLDLAQRYAVSESISSIAELTARAAAMSDGLSSETKIRMAAHVEQSIGYLKKALA